MQEIADEAGINKALLHYYYRSKDQLFNAVFEEVMSGFVPRLFGLLNSDLPLEVKVYQIAERYTELLTNHRELPLFILSELQNDPKRITNKIPTGREVFKNLEDQLKREFEKGNIREIKVEMFVMNLISMLVFPFAGRNLFQSVAGMDNDQYTAFLQERMIEVPKFIMNALKP